MGCQIESSYSSLRLTELLLYSGLTPTPHTHLFFNLLPTHHCPEGESVFAIFIYYCSIN